MADVPVAMDELSGRVVSGDRRAVARALSIVERGGALAQSLIGRLESTTNCPQVVGVTGVGGAGKSTLIAAMAMEWRRRDVTVGILAIDPSSAATGGALLGDRVRMEELHSDHGVFIRSMATRGSTGGVAAATSAAIVVLSAAGYQRIVVETIGVGQDEIAVARLADTIVVVEAPNMGDDVQALKAGLAEIADIFVVNKADLPGADRAVKHLRSTLSLNGVQSGWTPVILKTTAANGDGVAALLDALDSHRQWDSENDDRPGRNRAKDWRLNRSDATDKSESIGTSQGARVRLSGSELRIEIHSWSAPRRRALLRRVISALSDVSADEIDATVAEILEHRSVDIPIGTSNSQSQ